MVVITGNTPSYHHAREPHQGMRLHADASQGDIYRPICKRVWRIDDAKFLVDVMPRALNVAQTGRSGRGAARRADGRVLPAHRSAGAGDVEPASGVSPLRRAARWHCRRGSAAAVGEGPGDLRRQRCGVVRSGGRAVGARRAVVDAGRNDADGQRHLSGGPSASPAECPESGARASRTRRCATPT